MKKIFLRIVLLIFISLLFCKDNEKYSFIYFNSKLPGVGEEFSFPVVGEKYFRKNSDELSLNIPEIGYIQYKGFYTGIDEYFGKEGEFYKFKAIISEMETDNHVNGVEILDYYWHAMEDKSCIVYVKSDGEGLIDHIKPVDNEDDYLQEGFESIHMGVNPRRFRYPFGSGAIDVAVGSSWTASYDSRKIYVNMGSPPSLVSGQTTWTLKKVKEKKGRKIAHVNLSDEMILHANILVEFFGEKRFMVGALTGSVEGKYQWDVEDTQMLSARLITSLKGDFELDDETVSIKATRRFILKKLK